jgi:hypothetical protein
VHVSGQGYIRPLPAGVCVCVCVCVCVYTVYTVFERGLMYLTTLLNAGAHVLISIMLTQTSTNQH